MSDVYSLVRAAIENRQHVVAEYGGHIREMCPHTIGTKNGTQRALFFQFGGSSSHGLSLDGEWRCLRLSELSNISVKDGPWHTADNHSRPQTCIDLVDLEVAF